MMNLHAIQILFLKDLFLSRKALFAYLVAGLASVAVSCIPNPSLAFAGGILMITVAIACGIHMIGYLLISESSEQTRLFVMSLPVSILDYSIAKISVVITTYLIPWATMLSIATILTVAAPGAKLGSAIGLPVLFGFLLATFTLQLATAVATESFPWTICVVVACNVLLNIFLKEFYSIPEVLEITKGNKLIWPPIVLQIVAIESAVVVSAIVLSLVIQSRKRDLV